METLNLRSIAAKYEKGCIMCFANDNDIPIEQMDEFIEIVRETQEVEIIEIDMPEGWEERCYDPNDLEAVKKDEEEFEKYMHEIEKKEGK